MPIKSYRPYTASRRYITQVEYPELDRRARSEKSLLTKKRRTSGRNNQGIITIRHRGGGVKRHYRLVDFNQTDKMGVSAVVKQIEYDPNRSAFIFLAQYVDGAKRYHLAPQNLKVGDTILCAERTKIKPGNRLMLKNIPEGFNIYNVELTPGRGGQMVRSAGSSAILSSTEGEYAQVTLPSGEVRYVHKNCYGSIGVVSNPDHFNVVMGKAGRVRYKGRRPVVRGKVMNPVDHPHGGGEGRNPIGLKHPKTPWGKPALGVKTRKRKFTNKWIIKGRPRGRFVGGKKS
jgi:large subunit ribosomal protein L2